MMKAFFRTAGIVIGALVAVVIIGGVVATAFMEDGASLESEFINPPTSPVGLFAQPCAALEGSGVVAGASVLPAPHPASAQCSYTRDDRIVRLSITGPVPNGAEVMQNPDCRAVTLRQVPPTEVQPQACSMDSASLEGSDVNTVKVVRGTTAVTMNVTGAPLTEQEINDSAQRIADSIG